MVVGYALNAVCAMMNNYTWTVSRYCRLQLPPVAWFNCHYDVASIYYLLMMSLSKTKASNNNNNQNQKQNRESEQKTPSLDEWVNVFILFPFFFRVIWKMEKFNHFVFVICTAWLKAHHFQLYIVVVFSLSFE